MALMKLRDYNQEAKARYSVEMQWGYFVDAWIAKYPNLDFQPLFQRGYVWSERQQAAYIENVLKGCASGRDMYFNHPTWGTFKDFEKYPLVCVDGQQRLGAIIRFMGNRPPVFGGRLLREFDDWEQSPNNYSAMSFRLHVNNLKTDKDVYRWYRFLNDGGTVHTQEDPDKVRALL
jgi:uncharacterized protein with ParB-like and HNH nuclease domain